jgi:hypothetical protein
MATTTTRRGGGRSGRGRSGHGRPFEDTNTPYSDFELGKFYRLKLIHGDDILFERGILQDQMTLDFQVISRTYHVTETFKGEIHRSSMEFQVSPNCLRTRGLLYLPMFELIRGRWDAISVDCSSSMCRERHIIECEIKEIPPPPLKNEGDEESVGSDD